MNYKEVLIMMKCPECKKEIANSALACPTCGADLKGLKDKKDVAKGCSGCLIIIVVLIAFAIYNSPINRESSKARIINNTRGTMLRVGVYDDTKTNKLPSKVEIWFKGYGSWFLKPEINTGAAVKKIGRRKIGIRDQLYIYPDGRSGVEIEVPVLMTNDMNPEGSVRDMLTISIKDYNVEVNGLPVRAATGKLTHSYKRDSFPGQSQ